ncbi:MAG: alpha/beta hydrolase, partial [Chitinophagaceae bacterium]|nr:alpha/beta hydrolase [Chitinophagaceae bacterium]
MTYRIIVMTDSMKKFGLLTALLLGIFYVTAQTGVVSLNRAYRDVTYKTTESGESLKLDIFLPESLTTTTYPVLLYIHGGAWVRGNKNMNEPYFRKALREAALKNGFAVVSINYSLLNDSTRFPAPIADVKDATRWIYAHAAAYHLDTLNIGVLGESAGSHLALLTAYTNDETWEGDKNLEDHASNVNYVINNCGPTDINSLLKTDAGWFTILIAKLFFPKKIFELRNQLILQMTSHHIDDDKKKV